jgi:hypothetical protein
MRDRVSDLTLLEHAIQSFRQVVWFHGRATWSPSSVKAKSNTCVASTIISALSALSPSGTIDRPDGGFSSEPVSLCAGEDGHAERHVRDADPQKLSRMPTSSN